jgi:hypothetical protein
MRAVIVRRGPRCHVLRRGQRHGETWMPQSGEQVDRASSVESEWRTRNMSIYIPETLLYYWYCGNRICYATSRGFWWDFGGGKSLTVGAYAKVTHRGNLSQKGGGGSRMVPGGFAVCVLELVDTKSALNTPTTRSAARSPPSTQPAKPHLEQDRVACPELYCLVYVSFCLEIRTGNSQFQPRPRVDTAHPSRGRISRCSLVSKWAPFMRVGKRGVEPNNLIVSARIPFQTPSMTRSLLLGNEIQPAVSATHQPSIHWRRPRCRCKGTPDALYIGDMTNSLSRNEATPQISECHDGLGVVLFRIPLSQRCRGSRAPGLKQLDGLLLLAHSHCPSFSSVCRCR